ncbi:uncharacterized protein LOC134302155 [Trichomycterus rosablanca]|uniref:uncharacterized protein LOC134302155 n=1 Tax=Trichomycterus rosablanca TaxID=2290929 RepID=UPI002F3543D4
MGLLSETLWSLPLEAEPGENVTIWCQHDLTRAGYIFWYKQYFVTASMTTSLPVLVGCKHFKLSDPSSECYFFNGHKRMDMSVHMTTTCLTIITVDPADSAFYYCSFIKMNHMKFSTSTYLQVKEGNETHFRNLSKAHDVPCFSSPEDYISHAVCFLLVGGFGGVVVVLLGILIFITLKHEKKDTGAHMAKEDTEDQEHGSVNYAASQFDNKKNKRPQKHEKPADPYDVYSCVIYHKLA